VASRKPIDVDAAARDLSTLLWAAMATPGSELAALRALRGHVAHALDAAHV
jgi:hypothetical protein